MISIRNLCKSFGSLQVLKGLNLEVLEGETLVILGRSGVGKSVLLKHILGLESADSGSIEIDGKDTREIQLHKPELFPKKMGMLFQGGALFDSMTVGENVAFYLQQHEKMEEKQIQNIITEALKVVGLEGTQDKMPSDLSGGMRKRAALARLIAYRPEILLYDEPTTGLDPITAMQINELIKNIKKQLSATSIVVTHDLTSALDVGDRLAFFKDGVISFVAPKEEFLKIDDPVLQSFLENAVVKEDLGLKIRTRK